MKVGSLFSGIGGFDLGLERAGMEIVWQVENNPFCNKVLEKHWPNVKRYGDIKNVTNPEPVDLICGGFPCQPYSCAGKRLGAEDDRALWPEMFRIIQEARPRWVIGENVAGFINMGLDQSISDLEREGYTVQTFIIPACAVNAPHKRDRVWIIANSKESERKQSSRTRTGREGFTDGGEFTADAKSEQTLSTEQGRLHAESCGTDSDVPNAFSTGLQGSEPRQPLRCPRQSDRSRRDKESSWNENWLEVAARLCRVDDGLPAGLVRPKGWRVNSLKALGNSVVPQIVEIIGRAILEIERT
jgi:DNA (cytosine-5)-methyltransferase 1